MKFSDRYLTVAEANRRNYEKQARHYLKHAACVNQEYDQELLAHDLERAVRELGDLGRPPVALDACGGAGNAALKLQALGCDVYLVDISAHMVEIYRQDCLEAGYTASAETGEIGSFFAGTSRKFDLIVFCSALHHLEDPVLVLSCAQRALAPGGLIVTIFDPIRPSRSMRLLRQPLRILDRAVKRPSLIFTRAIPVIRRIFSGGSRHKQRTLVITEQNVGTLAEFHGGSGFDDGALVRDIEQSASLTMLCHDRYIGGCGRLEAILLKLIRRPNGFKLLLKSAPKA